ncbi:MAG: hypothetical protein WCO60_01120 [Verrucomicrobiota bacterium]
MKSPHFRISIHRFISTSLLVGFSLSGAAAQPSSETSRTIALKPIAFRAPLTPAEKLRKKTTSIVIPEVKFTDLPLNQAAEALTELSKESDRSGDNTKGVVILVQVPGGGAAGPTVTMPLLTNFKLADILNVITAVTDTKWRISGPYITIVPQ